MISIILTMSLILINTPQFSRHLWCHHFGRPTCIYTLYLQKYGIHVYSQLVT